MRYKKVEQKKKEGRGDGWEDQKNRK